MRGCCGGRLGQVVVHVLLVFCPLQVFLLYQNVHAFLWRGGVVVVVVIIVWWCSVLVAVFVVVGLYLLL